MQADDPGGLHLTAAHKGTIYAWWFVFQSILPTFTGGFADRYGYKKTLLSAITLNVIGYMMMAYMTSYWGFFFGVIVLATGTAFFKPSLQGSLAQNLTRELVPGLGHLLLDGQRRRGHRPAALASIRTGWVEVAVPHRGDRHVPELPHAVHLPTIESGADKTENPVQVFVNTMRNIVEPRLVAWLLIMSCFWLMMYQVWDLHPNFVTDWVDSSSVARTLNLPSIWTTEVADRGVRRYPGDPDQPEPGADHRLMIPVSWAVHGCERSRRWSSA